MSAGSPPRTWASLSGQALRGKPAENRLFRHARDAPNGRHTANPPARGPRREQPRAALPNAPRFTRRGAAGLPFERYLRARFVPRPPRGLGPRGVGRTCQRGRKVTLRSTPRAAARLQPLFVHNRTGRFRASAQQRPRGSHLTSQVPPGAATSWYPVGAALADALNRPTPLRRELHSRRTMRPPLEAFKMNAPAAQGATLA